MIVIVVLATISFILSIVALNYILKFNSTNLKDFISGNILLNSDFQDDFKCWNHSNNVKLIETNGTRCVYINNENATQARLWQEINIISGRVYRMTFTLSGSNHGASAILQYSKTGKQLFFNCDGNNDNKKYCWEIKPTITERSKLFLYTSKKGTFCFSNISLHDDDCSALIRIIIILVGVLVLTFIFGLILFVVLFGSRYFNIIFFIVIGSLAVCPALRINNETKSSVENRNLAKYKPLFESTTERCQINKNFGIDFNNWINDRFWGRFFWITWNRYIQAFIDKRYENKYAFQGRDGWLFAKHNYFDQDYINTCNKIKNNIDLLTDFFNKKGIKIYFAIMPEKECVYKEKHYFRKFDKEKIPEYLSLICSNNYLYLKTSIEKLKQDGYTHFKEDHHWTHLGAFGGYQGIMGMIMKDFNVSFLNKNDFTLKEFYGVYDNQVRVRAFQNNLKNGSTYYQLNLNDNLYKHVNKYLVFIPKETPEQIEVHDRYAVFKGNHNNYKIMVIGDSNIGYILPFISSSFFNSLFLYASGSSNKPDNWSIKSYTDIIFSYKPQIIVVLVRANNAISWRNLY